jgi:hypothetical protein
MNHYRLHLLKGWAGPSTRSECQITCLHRLRWQYIKFWTIGFHDLRGYAHGFLLNEVEGPKMATRGGWIGAKKFLAKYLAAVPNSPQTHEPTNMMSMTKKIGGCSLGTQQDTTKPTQKTKLKTELKRSRSEQQDSAFRPSYQTCLVCLPNMSRKLVENQNKTQTRSSYRTCPMSLPDMSEMHWTAQSYFGRKIERPTKRCPNNMKF